MISSTTASDWFNFFTTGWGAPFTLYVLVQICAVLTTRRRFRLLVLIPVPIMICVVAYVTNSYLHDANLWPIPLIFFGAIGAIATTVIWIVALVLGRREKLTPG